MLQSSMKQLLGVSVVIPAYNEEHYIQDCIEAILPQLKSGDEVLVIDNGSIDQTVALVPKHSQVRVLTQPRRGRIYAQQLGFESVRCPIIARIDADAIVCDNWLRVLRKNFDDNNTVAVSGLGESYDTFLKAFLKIGMDFWLTKVERPLAGAHIMWGSNCAFRQNIWQSKLASLSLEEDTHEDFTLSFALSKYGQVVYDRYMVVGFSNRLMRLTSTRIWKYPIMSVRTYYRAGMKYQAWLYLPVWLLCFILISPLVVVEELLQLVASISPFKSLRASRSVSNNE